MPADDSENESSESCGYVDDAIVIPPIGHAVALAPSAVPVAAAVPALVPVVSGVAVRLAAPHGSRQNIIIRK